MLPRFNEPTTEERYRMFREELFMSAVRAGSVTPGLPADTVDRWLDRMWIVLEKRMNEEELEMRRKGIGK